MALLSLEQLLGGVFVIAVPPKIGVGTSEEYRHALLDNYICYLFAFVMAAVNFLKYSLKNG